MSRLKGKVALITGAANGQGAAEARLFAENGAHVVLTDIDDDNGHAIADEISKTGANAIYIHHDVSSEVGWKSVISRAQDTFGGLNILVNNAGIVPRQSLDDTDISIWNRTLAVNLTGPMLGMKFSSPLIKKSGGGSIINVSSAAGLIAHYDAAYTASKWGLRGLTKTAAVEYAPWGIRVNSIHPGIISGTTLSGTASDDLFQSARACIPMERLGTTQECADLVLFLASEDSSFMTGCEIPIDGGYTNGGTMWMRRNAQKTMIEDT